MFISWLANNHEIEFFSEFLVKISVIFLCTHREKKNKGVYYYSINMVRDKKK